jgi:uncharacterized protein YjbI with pentapeptide repeats
MFSILPALVIFALIVVLLGFFWFWWAAPRDQVPPHLSDSQLKRLEVEDRLRQTNYQVLTAMGLGATFLVTLFQFFATGRQWSNDFELKLNQERLGQFAEALKDMNSDNVVSILAGIRIINSLGTQAPDGYGNHANDVLSAHVRKKTRSTEIMKETGECHDDFKKPYNEQYIGSDGKPIKGDREEAAEDVQAAMTALGKSKLAETRVSYSLGSCRSPMGIDGQRLRLEHLYLDDLDLSNTDFSCSLMSQSRFHRVSFYGANLQSVDFRGATFADYEIPASPTNGRIGNLLYVNENNKKLKELSRFETLINAIPKTVSEIFHEPSKKNAIDEARPPEGGPPEWQRYRCWVTDFRYADLRGANFEGGKLDGADLRNSDLTGANLCRADISRANFENAKGVTQHMIDQSCVGKSEGAPRDDDAQPFGLPSHIKPVPRCPEVKVCD